MWVLNVNEILESLLSKLNISFTEPISPSVNPLQEGKMTLSTKHLLHQILHYKYCAKNVLA